MCLCRHHSSRQETLDDHRKMTAPANLRHLCTVLYTLIIARMHLQIKLSAMLEHIGVYTKIEYELRVRILQK